MDTSGAILAPLGVLALFAVGLRERTVILLSALPAALAALAIVALVREPAGREPLRRPLLHVFRGFPVSFRRFLLAVGVFGLGDFADTFYILYAVGVLTPRLGAAAAATASVALYALHNVLYAGLSYGGGWLADRLNKRALLVAGYTCAALAASLMLAGVTSWPGLAAMFTLGGAGVGLYEAVEDAVGAELLPDRIRGSGFGALAVVTGLGDLVSSVTVGWLWAMAGRGAAFSLALALMAAGALFMVRLARASRSEPAGATP